MLRVKEIKNNDNGTIYLDPYYIDYLCFTDASGSSNTLTLTNNNGLASPITLEYSTDKVNWTTWTESNNVRTYTIPANGKVYLRGDNATFNSKTDANTYRFSSSGNINASGDLTTLLNKFATETLPKGAFNMLFNCMTTLKSVPKLIATTLGEKSYGNLFFGCTGLTDASSISIAVTNLPLGAFASMFYNCSNLTTPPTFTSSPLTIATNTFANMFFGCTSLTTAPSLTISSISGTSACQNMFRECSSLTDASNFKLNATSLDKRSCYTMFQDCSNLVTPPEIMATTLYGSSSDSGNGSLAGMFRNCSKLNTIKVHFTSWNTQATQNWTYGCKNSGTFYKPSSLPSTKNTSGNTSNPHYIPYNWTVSNI